MATVPRFVRSPSHSREEDVYQDIVRIKPRSEDAYRVLALEVLDLKEGAGLAAGAGVGGAVERLREIARYLGLEETIEEELRGLK